MFPNIFVIVLKYIWNTFQHIRKAKMLLTSIMTTDREINLKMLLSEILHLDCVRYEDMSCPDQTGACRYRLRSNKSKK